MERNTLFTHKIKPFTLTTFFFFFSYLNYFANINHIGRLLDPKGPNIYLLASNVSFVLKVDLSAVFPLMRICIFNHLYRHVFICIFKGFKTSSLCHVFFTILSAGGNASLQGSAEIISVIIENYFYFAGNRLYNNTSIKHHEGAQMSCFYCSNQSLTVRKIVKI